MPSALTFKRAESSPSVSLHLHDLPSSSSSPNTSLPEGHLSLRTLSAPINPIDLLVLVGKYPVKPQSHVSDQPIPGYDGLLQVVQSAHPAYAPGDYVLPREHGFGTWRTHVTCAAEKVVKLDVPKIDPKVGAILKMGACPAWLLLEEASPALKEGDWIIQNGSTSVIAQLVIQYAKLRGVHTINVVRDRPEAEFEKVKKHLQGLGGDIVLSESQLQTGSTPPELEGKRIVLALDCVFGPSGERLAHLLTQGGSYTNFGMLAGPASKLSITPDLIFFKAVTFKPFRLSKSLGAKTEAEVGALMQKLNAMFEKGEVKVPALDVVSWSEGAKEGELVGAVERAKDKGVGNRKSVFVFE